MKRTIITAVALTMALLAGGVSGAAAANLIGSKDVANNSLRSADLKDGKAVAKRDLKPGLAAQIDAPGPAGPAGADGTDGTNGINGTNGADGADGGPGLSNVRADEPYGQSVAAHSVGVAFAVCPQGKAAISGGYRLNAPQSEAFQGGGYAVPGVTAIASEPVGVIDGQVVNTYQSAAFPQDADGRFLPNAWAVTVQNDTDSAQEVRAAVVCATVAG